MAAVWTWLHFSRCIRAGFCSAGLHCVQGLLSESACLEASACWGEVHPFTTVLRVQPRAVRIPSFVV